jgi:excisionase family DNA binding protein
MENKIITLLSYEELKNLIKESVHEEFLLKKEKDLLNFKETCEYLGISVSALNKWKSENRIPYKKLGKRVFFSRQEIYDSLKSSNYSKLKDINH